MASVEGIGVGGCHMHDLHRKEDVKEERSRMGKYLIMHGKVCDWAERARFIWVGVGGRRMQDIYRKDV